MQYLRDNNGVLESSADGTTWKEVFLNTGEPLKIGGLQLRDNAGALEVSADNGATWEPVGSGEAPSEIDNPVTLGILQIKDDAGTLQVSDDAGVTWHDLYSADWPLSLTTGKFYPPQYVQAEDPASSVWAGAIALWENTADGSRWLLYKDSGGTVQRVCLTSTAPQLRLNGAAIEIFVDGMGWLPLYMVGYTELADSYFVPPYIEQSAEPTYADPIMANTGSLGIWKDTDDSKVYLIFNDNGVVKKTELT